MKIYGSTEYIQPKDVKVGNLQLEVISQWYFKTKAVCFEKYTKTGGDTVIIPYALRRCSKVFSDTHTKWDYVEELDEETKQELISMGCSLSNRKGEVA